MEIVIVSDITIMIQNRGGKARLIPAFIAFLAILCVCLPACSDRNDSLPATMDYNDQPAYFISTTEEKDIAAQILDLCAELKVAKSLEEERALDAAARNLAAGIKKGGLNLISKMDNDRINETMLDMGVTDNAFRSLLLNVMKTKDVKSRVVESLGKDLVSGRYTHFGVGASRSWWPPTIIVAVLFTRRTADLNSFPRSAIPGEEVALSGRILFNGANLSVLVQGPNKTETFHPGILTGGLFSQQIVFHQAGKNQVEVTFDMDTGPEVAALFPVIVEGGKKVRESGPLEHMEVTSLPQARQRILDLINQERWSRHILPVTLDENLNEIAQKYAEEMKESGLVAHVSPKSGDCADRAKAAGLPVQRISENIAVNQTIEQVHESLMVSPAHRENILDGEVDWVGLGVAFTKDKNQVFVVENFARYHQGRH